MDEHILGLQVEMGHTASMHVGERLEQRAHDRARLGLVEPACRAAVRLVGHVPEELHSLEKLQHEHGPI